MCFLPGRRRAWQSVDMTPERRDDIQTGFPKFITVPCGSPGIKIGVGKFDCFFDFFCDLLVIQQHVVQPPYVGIFNSFSPVIEI